MTSDAYRLRVMLAIQQATRDGFPQFAAALAVWLHNSIPLSDRVTGNHEQKTNERISSPKR